MVPGAGIRIFEAAGRPLAKLALTGGGRCNLTNSFASVKDLRHVYPRGAVFMKRALKEFGPEDTMEWFSSRGVRLVTQPDERVFPASGDAMEIVHTLLSAMDGVEILCGRRLSADDIPSGGPVVVTTGGGRGMELLRGLPVRIEPPVPSLFSFTLDRGSAAGLCSLMGVSADAEISIPGTDFRSRGPLLITDWGLSGPAVLRLSSHAARHLARCSYRAPLSVNWTALPPEEVRRTLAEMRVSQARRRVGSVHPFGLPARLWEYLASRAGTDPLCNWASLGNRGLESLAAVLSADNYAISGKTRFKDEFVTCGGVGLDSVNISTLECRQRKGLFFAGEVLDIDAVTGGFNLQAAWTTAYMAAKSTASSL